MVNKINKIIMGYDWELFKTIDGNKKSVVAIPFLNGQQNPRVSITFVSSTSSSEDDTYFPTQMNKLSEKAWNILIKSSCYLLDQNPIVYIGNELTNEEIECGKLIKMNIGNTMIINSTNYCGRKLYGAM